MGVARRKADLEVRASVLVKGDVSVQDGHAAGITTLPEIQIARCKCTGRFDTEIDIDPFQR